MWYIDEDFDNTISSALLTNLKQFEPDPELLEQYQGFVYLIYEKSSGKKYLGKKFFWKPKKLPKTKTRRRVVRTRVESDWRDYYGSSAEVKQLVEENGVDNYQRIILKLCETKGLCSYWEAKLQFQFDVLLRDDFYNELINCRIHSKHLRLNNE